MFFENNIICKQYVLLKYNISNIKQLHSLYFLNDKMRKLIVRETTDYIFRIL